MKVCLVSDTLPGYHSTWSGAELLCWRLGDMLQKEGQEVFFITSSFKEKNIPKDKKVFQLPIPVNKISKFIPFFPLFSTHFPIDFYSTFYSLILLKKIKPDIIHFHAKKLFLPIMTANLLLEISTVFTVLDYFIICPLNTLMKFNGKICSEPQGAHCSKCVYHTQYRIKRIFQPIWVKKSFSKARAEIFSYFIKKLNEIVTLTNTSKNRLIQHGLPEEKIKVIYYQLTPEISKIKARPIFSENFKILFVGSFYPHKGLSVLIRAIPSVISKIPDAKLTVVGTGNQYCKEEIKKLVNSLEINQYIDFLGQKKNEEVLQIILESDVVVVPEQWPSDFGPVILLEAMALGKPIVASKIGSILEFIKDDLSGMLVEPDQPKQFAEKIIKLYENKALAQMIGEKAKESIRFLFKNNQAQEIIKLYNEITNL